MNEKRDSNFSGNKSESEIPLGSGFTAFRLHAINKLYEELNIKPGVRALTHGHKPVEQDRYGMERFDPKSHTQETNEMAAYFISGIWKDMRGWIDAHPDELPEAKGHILTTLSPAKMEELRKSNPAEALATIDSSVKDFHFIALVNWFARQESLLKSLGEGKLGSNETYHAQAYARFKELVKAGKNKTTSNESYGQHNFVSTKPSTEVVPHIRAGLNTGRDFMLNITGVLPEVYKREQGVFPKENELAYLAEGSTQLIVAMAQSHIQVFDKLRRKLKINGKEKGPFDHSKFWLARKGKVVTLEVNPGILDELEFEIGDPFPDFPKTMCPALSAPGREGRNTVVEMYDWIKILAKKYYFPKFARK